MTIDAWLTGSECRNKLTGTWHTRKTNTQRYGIEGSIDKVHLF
jgi:hypothetical protein